MGRRYKIIVFFISVTVIFLFHLFLLHWLDDKNIVSVILAPGPHSQGGAIFIAIIFFIIRIFTLVLLPGIILYITAFLIMDFFLPGIKKENLRKNDKPSIS